MHTQEVEIDNRYKHRLGRSPKGIIMFAQTPGTDAAGWNIYPTLTSNKQNCSIEN